MNESSFDRLVMGLTSAERISLLNKMNESNSLQTPQISNVEKINIKEDEIDLSKKIKKESFFLKLILKIKSFFSGTSLEITYNNYLLLNIARDVQSKNPLILDPRTKELKTAFLDQIRKLKQVSEYFKMGCAIYEEDPGTFLAFMGSLIFTDLESKFEEDANPYTFPFDQEISNDLRTTLLRHMDEILQTVPLDQKTRMYACVQSLNWINQFTHIPFDKIISRFRPTGKSIYICNSDSIQNELATMCKVMCVNTQIYPEVLESFFLLTYQTQDGENKEIKAGNASKKNKKLNSEQLNQECDSYIEKSMEQIACIQKFLSEVPIVKITKIAQGSASWIPDKLEGAEDWFVKFKAQCKKTFDKNWENWLKDKARYQILDSIKKMFGCDDFPTIENRPWTTAWDGIPFAKEYSLGFLFNFFKITFPKLLRTLRVLMMEGEFLKRENQAEFTESYNAMNSLSQNLLSLNSSLAPTGSYGGIFASANDTQSRTIQNYSKLTSLVGTIENDAQNLIFQFKNSTESIIRILSGILNPVKNAKYETLANLTSIQGSLNNKFRENLSKVKEDLEKSLDILAEIQNTESNSVSS